MKKIISKLPLLLLLGALSACSSKEGKKDEATTAQTAPATAQIADIAGQLKNTQWIGDGTNQYPLAYTFGEDNSFQMSDMSGEPVLVYTGQYTLSGDTVVLEVTGLVDAKEANFAMKGYVQKLVLQNDGLLLVEDRDPGKQPTRLSKPDRFVRPQVQ